MQITSFDFHNTVAHCDPWFDLEIRELPARVLELLASWDGARADAGMQEESVARYRKLRLKIMETGREQDAQSCIEQVFGEVGHQARSEAITDAIEQLMRDCLPHLSPVPGAVETISSLIDSDVPVGIISSAVYHPFLEWALADFGLLDRLAFVATSASIGYYKSDVRIYHCAYQLMGANTDLGVHVGDSPRWDVATAQNAGLGTVLYADPNGKKTELPAGVRPDLILTSLVDAHEPILNLLKQRETGAVHQ